MQYAASVHTHTHTGAGPPLPRRMAQHERVIGAQFGCRRTSHVLIALPGSGADFTTFTTRALPHGRRWSCAAAPHPRSRTGRNGDGGESGGGYLAAYAAFRTASANDTGCPEQGSGPGSEQEAAASLTARPATSAAATSTLRQQPTQPAPAAKAAVDDLVASTQAKLAAVQAKLAAVRIKLGVAQSNRTAAQTQTQTHRRTQSLPMPGIAELAARTGRVQQRWYTARPRLGSRPGPGPDGRHSDPARGTQQRRETHRDLRRRRLMFASSFLVE